MKAGDKYESKGGMGFVIKAVSKKEITVEVERTVRKGGKHEPQQMEKRTRVIPVNDWHFFVAPYEPLS